MLDAGTADSEFADHELVLLEEACRVRDRIVELDAAVTKDGLMIQPVPGSIRRSLGRGSSALPWPGCWCRGASRRWLRITCRRPAAGVVFMAAGADGPEHLRVGSGLTLSDTAQWHRQRLAWFRANLEKLRESRSPLEFLLETREASRPTYRGTGGSA